MLKEKHERDFIDLANQEMEELKSKEVSLRSKIEEMLIEDDPDSRRDIIIEIRAGTGGQEAALFAADLFRMYSKYAQVKGWKVLTE